MYKDSTAAIVSQDPRTCFVFMRIREEEEEAARSYMCMYEREWKTGKKCVMPGVCIHVCVAEGGGDSGEKEPRLNLQNPFHVRLVPCLCLLVIFTHRPGIAFSVLADSVTDTKCLQHNFGRLFSACFSLLKTDLNEGEKWIAQITRCLTAIFDLAYM